MCHELQQQQQQEQPQTKQQVGRIKKLAHVWFYKVEQFIVILRDI